MTLLESIVAFIVLALVGLACLDLSRGALALERSSAEWTVSVARAESAVAEAQVGAALPPDMMRSSTASGDATRGDGTLPIRVSRSNARDNLDIIEVVVPMPNGNQFSLHRLVRRRDPAARVAAALAQPASGASR